MKRSLIAGVITAALVPLVGCSGGDGTIAVEVINSTPPSLPETTSPPKNKKAANANKGNNKTKKVTKPKVRASGNRVPIEVTVPTTAPPAQATANASSGNYVDRVGWIKIPRIGLDEEVWEPYDDNDDDATYAALDKGPTFWGNDTMPGQKGNVVLGAHRTSNGGPFLYINELVPGDEIIATGPNGVPNTYHVTETVFVGPDDTWILDNRDGKTITLFACHPPGSTRQRIVVYGEMAN